MVAVVLFGLAAFCLVHHRQCMPPALGISHASVGGVSWTGGVFCTFCAAGVVQ
jgi:hypothetical protein